MAYIRGEGKNNANFVTKDLYKIYKTRSKDPVPYNVFSKVIKEYNDRVINAIIYENLEYKMPYRIGYLRIQRRKLTPFLKDGEIKKTHILPDWKKTKEYWRNEYPGKTDIDIKNIPNKKIMRYLNEHTNGYSVRFFWDKCISNVKNQNCYVFKATRTTKENLAKFIKKIGRIEYFE